MAAAKVFAIGEILEHILLDLAQEAMDTTDYHRLEPIMSLAPLHRVNSFFDGTIKGSPKLQRAILAQNILPTSRPVPVNLSISAATSDIKPLRWLLEIELGLKIKRTCQNPADIFHFDLPTAKDLEVDPMTPMRYTMYVRNDHCAVNREKMRTFSARSSDSVASWRKVRVVMGGPRETVSKIMVILNIPLSQSNYLFDFTDRSTLGEVFDQYVEIVQLMNEEDAASLMEEDAGLRQAKRDKFEFDLAMFGGYGPYRSGYDSTQEKRRRKKEEFNKHLAKHVERRRSSAVNDQLSGTRRARKLDEDLDNHFSRRQLSTSDAIAPRSSGTSVATDAARHRAVQKPTKVTVADVKGRKQPVKTSKGDNVSGKESSTGLYQRCGLQ